MLREYVISSNIRSIGYLNNILEIEFNDCSIYQYYDVPYTLYNQIMNAPSKGKFFAAFIKNKYSYKRIF